MSLVSHILDSFQTDCAEHPARQLVYDVTAYLYRYSTQTLDALPDGRRAFVLYADLTGDPETTVRRIYRDFRFHLSDAFSEVLTLEAQKARTYRSKHAYSLEQEGLSRERVFYDYRDIFERFGFPSGREDTPEKTGAAQNRTSTN